MLGETTVKIHSAVKKVIPISQASNTNGDYIPFPHVSLRLCLPNLLDACGSDLWAPGNDFLQQPSVNSSRKVKNTRVSQRLEIYKTALSTRNETIPLTLRFPSGQTAQVLWETQISTTRFRKFITIFDTRGGTLQRHEQIFPISQTSRKTVGELRSHPREHSVCACPYFLPRSGAQPLGTNLWDPDIVRITRSENEENPESL